VSYVYLMRNGTADLVKIGRGRDIASRRSDFRTGNPEELTVIDAIETDADSRGEAFLHGMYQSRRVTGEFFQLTEEQALEGAGFLREFLSKDLPVEQDAKRLAALECDAPARQPDEEEFALHRELLEAREEKYRLEVKCARLENRLRVRTGTSEGLIDLVSWRPHTVTRFDERQFRLSYPELHESYLRTSRQRTFRLLWS
jgi:Meiotically up-regulated gene 113